MKIEKHEKHPLSIYLGVAGMPGKGFVTFSENVVI